ncbi:MAG TPA: hypothetical protein VG273_14295 [Bryobacteraceae bacterium]|nr:hypothetical protein [Bryobacteraceae bacterium]
MRRAVWLVPAVLLLVSFAVKSLLPDAPLILFMAALVAYMVLQGRLERWKCPRCGQRFQRDGKVAAECAGCGLPKWGGSDRATLQ